MEELYERYYGRLLAWCAAMTGGRRAEAEDLVQEVFLTALTHLTDWEDLGPNQRWAWLRRVAKNRYIDRLRKYAREVYPGEETLALSGFEEDFTRGQTAALIAALPEEERDLFELRYFEGYNATELGEMFSLPPSTVRARLLAARRRLRQALEES